MSFKIIGFACFVTSLVVTGGAVSDNKAEEPSARGSIPGNIASLLPKRQEQPWRNDTRSAPSSAPTQISRTKPFELLSSSGHHVTVRLSTSSVPRSTPPDTPFQPASSGSAPWSTSLPVVSAISSTAIPADPTPLSSYPLPNFTSGVTPSLSGFVITLTANTSSLSSTSSVEQGDYSVSLSTTPVLVTYMATTLSSKARLSFVSSTSAPPSDTSTVITPPANTLAQEISSATVASNTPPYLSPSVVASSDTHLSTTPFNTTMPTSTSNAPIPSAPVMTVSSIFTFVLSASSITAPILSLGPGSQWRNNATSVTVTTPDITLQQPSIIPSAYGGWNTALTKTSPESATSIGGAEVPPAQQASSNSTVLYTSYTSRAPDWKTSTLPTPRLNSTKSDGATTSRIVLLATTSSTLRTISTTSFSISVMSPTKTVIVALPPPGSTTSSGTSGSPTSPPLTVSQKAGVVIASTTGLLIAVVAAIYLVRRYRMNKASIYPKVAYLYAPPAAGCDHNGDLEEALMSGGSSGMPPMVRNDFRAPTGAVEYGHASSSNLLPPPFSDPGNPFRDPGSASHDSEKYTQSHVPAPTETEAAFAAAINGYRGTSHDSSVFDAPVTRQARDTACLSVALDRFRDSEPKSASRCGVLNEITSMAYATTARSPSNPSLPYSQLHQGFHSSHSLPCLRETMYTDSCRDPFGHDLLLKVDTCAETPDFATVYAPSTGSSLSIPANVPIREQSRNPWASSMMSTCLEAPIKPLNKRFEPPSPISPDATIVASECFSPVFGHHSSSACFTSSPKQDEVTMSPISPSYGAVHRGWDEIKRYSAERVVPSMASLSPPLGYCSPVQTKKKSLPQLRRKDPILTGLGEVQQSRSHLSLAP